MIVRIFQVTTEDGRAGEFGKFFRDTALPLVRSQPGLIHVTAGAARPETPNDFAMTMVWRDEAALAAFAGADWRQPHIHPDEEGVVASRRLAHYTLVD